MKYFVFSFILLIFHCNNLFGFGQNRVATKDIRYEICSTEHFDIYYYDEGRAILPFVVDVLEITYKDITSTMNFDIPEKIPFFLYVSHNDFEQTNIVPIGEGTGGVTEAYKYRFTVPHLGPKEWLEDVIRHEFTHVVEFNVLYSGFWKSIRLTKSMFYPNWLMEGYAVYNQKDFDKAEQDMYLRDAVILPPSTAGDKESNPESEETKDRLLPIDYLHSFNHVQPGQVMLAYKESGALINFLDEEYGIDKVNEILKLYREKFEANSLLKETIGLDMESLDKRFREWVREKYSFGAEELKEPETYGKKNNQDRNVPYV